MSIHLMLDESLLNDEILNRISNLINELKKLKKPLIIHILRKSETSEYFRKLGSILSEVYEFSIMLYEYDDRNDLVNECMKILNECKDCIIYTTFNLGIVNDRIKYV